MPNLYTPLQHSYEKAALMALPPHAHDIAEHLLALTPLNELLFLQQTNQPNRDLLAQHKVPTALWPDIVKAAVLAKVTGFMDNPQWTKEEILYLIKAACTAADLPLKAYTLAEVMERSIDKMPVLHQWLTRLTQQLQHLQQTRKTV